MILFHYSSFFLKLLYKIIALIIFYGNGTLRQTSVMRRHLMVRWPSDNRQMVVRYIMRANTLIRYLNLINHLSS